MKKLLALLMAMLMVISLFGACSSEKAEDTKDDEEVTEEKADEKEDKEEDKDEDKKKERLDAEVGDIIEFGAYEQDADTSNGKEAIEWRVLDVEDGKALLISEYGLDAKPYNEEMEAITWEDCTLREWLNEDFADEAFSSKEKKRILTTRVIAEDNEEYGTDAGNDTEDEIFLLSISEAEKYFDSDEDRECEPTEYAKENGAYVSDYNGNCCWWWLRSPGYYQLNAAFVFNVGDVIEFGFDVYYDYIAVRPALWIDLES